MARALYYRPDLRARRGFLSLCLLSFVMPTLVLITGLVALLGRSGLLTPLLGEHWNLYGLTGILIAHVYLNMPLAVRVMLQQLQAIPATSWQLAAQLKLNRLQRLRHIEWPALKGALLMLFGFIAVLCFNSFAVVLALGGGPRATTLEVAIYQALKYDFNIPEALTLAWTQFIIAGLLFLLLSRLGSVSWLSADTGDSHWRPRPQGLQRQLHGFIYYATWLLLLLPIIALLPGIAGADLARFSWLAVLQPTLITLLLGLTAATAALALAYLMLLPVRRAHVRGHPHRQHLLEWLATHTLVAPAMVLSVGLFILLLPRLDLDTWGILFVALLNVAVVIPFAVQKIKPRLFQFDQQYHQLACSLKLSGWTRWRIEWPFIRPAFLTTFALVLLLAMGDVAIFSIFGNEQWTTLPWLIYGYASTYRIGEASIASLLLLLICALIVWTVEKVHPHATH